MGLRGEQPEREGEGLARAGDTSERSFRKGRGVLRRVAGRGWRFGNSRPERGQKSRVLVRHLWWRPLACWRVTPGWRLGETGREGSEQVASGRDKARR